MPGEKLEPGWYLESESGRYKLVMQASDGNLVLYNEGKALWSSRPTGAGSFAVMQGDGNFVIYSSGTAKWNSHTAGFPGASLHIQNDSNVIIYHEGHAIWDWGNGYIGEVLNSGTTLHPGAYLLSPDHQYRFIMQGDGNLVLYQEGKALWASGIEGSGAAAVMQSDGNLVIYNNGVAKWNSNTADFPGASLQVQNDGNVVIYHRGHPVWARTSGYIGWLLNPGESLEANAYLLSPGHRYALIMQGSDGNLVLYDEGKAVWSTGPSGSGSSAVMQGDGNFVVYSGGAAKWNSTTAGFSGSSLDLQDDGNLVIYQSGKAIWDWESGRLTGSTQAEAIVSAAASQAGIPYCFGGGNQFGPTACGGMSKTFDCTGLTMYAVYQATGKVLSHDGHQATEGGQLIYNQSELQPGDLVFFGGPLSNFEHAGVYAGGGKIWDALNYGIPVQEHTFAQVGLPFVGGARYWH